MKDKKEIEKLNKFEFYQLSDRELLNCLSYDKLLVNKALEALIEKYKQELYNYMFRLGINSNYWDDLFQSVWIYLYYYPRKEIINNLRDFLFISLKYKFLDLLKTDKIMNSAIENNFNIEYVHSKNELIKSIEDNDLIEIVGDILDKEENKVDSNIFILKYVNDLNVDEIQKIFPIEKKTIYKKLERMKNKIQNRLYNLINNI